ncbi:MULTISPECIES: DUF4828 domain-containing protein [unclassified Enterococcus]|uniref:DUF4828 domain-containing protein n=1 Tax=unclassified Enterococcus TaxID=2608891 RepID=UPI001F14F343|nr:MULTISPECIES: DUF4828 domain-containing protein [unclassified Enterococcus]
MFVTLAGSLFFRKKKQTRQLFDPAQYCGTWSFEDENGQKHHLTISSDFTLSINDHPLGTTVIKVDADQLVVRDQYGFYLTFSYPDMTFYDESAESYYPLSRS